MKKTKRDLLLETNRRLQETAQELFMAKRELERNNKALENELNTLKHIARPKAEKGLKAAPGKKLTASIAEDLSLSYITLLESYVKTKNLDQNESLVEEFCRKLMEYGVTPKGIIGIHLKSVPQVKTIGDLETKRVTFESRMVLLKVMTSYASLLRNKVAGSL